MNSSTVALIKVDHFAYNLLTDKGYYVIYKSCFKAGN